jgi:hypothetical protein
MTRKDFELIAAVLKAKSPWIKDCRPPYREIVGELAKDFATMCAAQNPRFDRTRFLKACGVE